MLSAAAFNTLVKILDEPPAHVKFIFATTEPHKVLATVQSCCQIYDFRNVSAGDIADHLKLLLNKEQVLFEDDLVLSVAKMANGSMRDGLSLLDRLISTGVSPLSTDLLEEFLGQPNIERIYELIEVIGQQDAAGALTQIDALIRNGLSEAQIVDALIDALRDLMIINTAGMQPDLVVLTQQQTQKAEALAQQFDAAALIYMVTALEKLRWTVKNSDTPRTLLEASVLRFTLSNHFINIDTLLTKLSESDITESLSNESIRIVEMGQVALKPVKPKKKLNVLLSIVLGLLGGIGLAFFLEYLDQAIHTEDDVQRYLDLPVLAVIPLADQAGTGYRHKKRVQGAREIKNSKLKMQN